MPTPVCMQRHSSEAITGTLGKHELGQGHRSHHVEVDVELEAFDDGFVPSGCSFPARLRRGRPARNLKRDISVLSDALDCDLACEAYSTSVGRSEPWGTYLRLRGVDGNGDLLVERNQTEEPQLEELAERMLSSLWRRGLGELVRDDLYDVHGFSLWSVVGEIGSKTEYHVDYSEPYRHKTNVICPPIHAVTLQLTPLPNDFVVEGGMFGAHIDGLEHYRVHGYKASLQRPTNGLPTADWGTSDGWRFTPFRFNQATVIPGDMPHAATTIQSWPEAMKRLVVGINTCSSVEGPSEMDMPQHSRTFKRALKLRRLEQKLLASGGERLAKLLANKMQKYSICLSEENRSCTNSSVII